jgi:hypothetical protein
LLGVNESILAQAIIPVRNILSRFSRAREILLDD